MSSIQYIYTNKLFYFLPGIDDSVVEFIDEAQADCRSMHSFGSLRVVTIHFCTAYPVNGS